MILKCLKRVHKKTWHSMPCRQQSTHTTSTPNNSTFGALELYRMCLSRPKIATSPNVWLHVPLWQSKRLSTGQGDGTNRRRRGKDKGGDDRGGSRRGRSEDTDPVGEGRVKEDWQGKSSSSYAAAEVEEDDSYLFMGATAVSFARQMHLQPAIEPTLLL